MVNEIERKALSETAEYVFDGDVPNLWEEALDKLSARKVQKVLDYISEHRISVKYPVLYFNKVVKKEVEKMSMPPRAVGGRKPKTKKTNTPEKYDVVGEGFNREGAKLFVAKFKEVIGEA